MVGATGWDDESEVAFRDGFLPTRVNLAGALPKKPKAFAGMALPEGMSHEDTVAWTLHLLQRRLAYRESGLYRRHFDINDVPLQTWNLEYQSGRTRYSLNCTKENQQTPPIDSSSIVHQDTTRVRTLFSAQHGQAH